MLSLWILCETLLMGGSLAETVVGIGAVVLAILGLVGMYPGVLLAVSIIAIGSAFVLEGSSVASRFDLMTREMGWGSEAVGMTTEFIGGVSGIILGVLALLGIVPNVLLPVAAIVYGVTLLLGAGIQSRLTELEIQCDVTHETTRTVAREALSAASGIRVLFGIGAVTLGILSVVGLAAPVVLTLVAVLAAGSAMLFTGAAASGTIFGITRYCEPQHMAS